MLCLSKNPFSSFLILPIIFFFQFFIIPLKLDKGGKLVWRWLTIARAAKKVNKTFSDIRFVNFYNMLTCSMAKWSGRVINFYFINIFTYYYIHYFELKVYTNFMLYALNAICQKSSLNLLSQNLLCSWNDVSSALKFYFIDIFIHFDNFFVFKIWPTFVLYIPNSLRQISNVNLLAKSCWPIPY